MTSYHTRHDNTTVDRGADPAARARGGARQIDRRRTRAAAALDSRRPPPPPPPLLSVSSVITRKNTFQFSTRRLAGAFPRQ